MIFHAVPWYVLLKPVRQLWSSVFTWLTVVLGPVLQKTIPWGEPGEEWQWQDLLSLVCQLMTCVSENFDVVHLNMLLAILLFLYCANKMGVITMIKQGIKEGWVYWTQRLNLYLWNIDESLVREQCRPTGTYCTTKSRHELDYLEMLHRVDKEHLRDQDEMVQRFLDNGLKFRGYRNYLLDTVNNCEIVTQKYRATVTKDKPQGDPALLREMMFVIHILEQEQKNLEIELRKWIWD